MVQDEKADLSTEKTEIDAAAIIEACESAFRICVRRFPHHIKAVYRLAHIYATFSSKKVRPCLWYVYLQTS